MLARHLLCAVPQLLDPNFNRAVVLMLEHTEQGALGLVINNPTPTLLREVAGSLDLEWAGDPQEPVWIGGPVETMRGWILHDQAGWDPQGEEVVPGLWLTTSLDPVIRAGNATFGAAPSRYRLMLGYAGWGPGQLEAEIAAGSWVLVPVGDEGIGADFLLDADAQDLWQGALESIGVDPLRLVGLQGNQVLH